MANKEQQTWLAKNTSSLLALFWTGSLVIMIFCMYMGVGKSDESTKTQIITGLFNIAIVILSYYFGASQGSIKNRDKLYEMLETKKDEETKP